MFDPSIQIEEGHDNRYMLACIIGKRAIQLNKGSEMFVGCESANNVTIAICEYKANKLTYTNGISEEKIEYKKGF